MKNLMLGEAIQPQIPPCGRNDNRYAYLNRKMPDGCHSTTETRVHHQVRSDICKSYIT